MSQTSAKAAYPSADIAMQAARFAREANRWPDELAAAEAAVALEPGRSDAWIMVASAATRLRDYDRADAAQLKALELATDPVLRDRLLVDRSWSLANQRRYAEAASIARSELPTVKLDANARNILGATLMTVGFGAEAVPHLEFAASELGQRADVLFNLAVAYSSVGRNPDAELVLERILAEHPGYMPAYEMLGEMQSPTPERNQVERLRAIRGRMPPGPDTSYVDFALFNQLHGLERDDEAWRVLVRANEAKRRTLQWSPSDDVAIANSLRALAATLPAPVARQGSPRTIFITSLPRTGSTLIERIFAAHSQVAALGELEAFGRALKAAAGLPAAPYVDGAVGKAQGLDWASIGDRYRAEVGGLTGEAPVSTDKLPLNWWYAPFIAAALPDASIIHVSRDPMDALFGAYKRSFGAAFKWSYDFGDLAAHYGVYRRLMEDWRAILGERLIDVRYEALVSDPETTIPQLLARCGLDFEEACLAPHLSKGSVSTPSAAQVRKPVTASKIGNWRRHAEQLEPLRALLQRDGWVDADGNEVAA